MEKISAKEMKRSYAYVITAGTLFGLVVFGGQIFANLGLSLYQMSLTLYALNCILPLCQGI